MPIGKAARLCPHAAFLSVDMDKYARASGEIMAILSEYSPLVEPTSIDEAFLDVTGTDGLFGPPLLVAKTIKARIRKEVKLTASAGVAPNKFLAKLASDLEKPDGLVEVKSGEEGAFLRDLPIGKLRGVGLVTARELQAMGVETIGQLARLPVDVLVKRFGKTGAILHELAYGRDDSPVEAFAPPKSMGAEETFAEDTSDLDRLRRTLLAQCERVARELRDAGYAGRTVTLKLRYADFRMITRSLTGEVTQDGLEIFRRARSLLERVPLPDPARLIGVSVSRLASGASAQLGLFSDLDARRARLARAMDALGRRFGDRALIAASLLMMPPPKRG
jgi:DNA polymerase-4